jgi:hypothetical protein
MALINDKNRNSFATIVWLSVEQVVGSQIPVTQEYLELVVYQVRV